MKKAMICPFKDVCDSSASCNEEYSYFVYERCVEYASNLLYFSTALPHVCPLFDSEKSTCKHDQRHCEPNENGLHNAIVNDNQGALDYRACPTFSEWFWNTKAKAK